MPWTFGNQQIDDATPERMALVQHAIDAPEGMERANGFYSHAGESPGRGWLIMRRKSLDALNQNALHELVMTDHLAHEVRFKNLVFVKAVAIVPGHTDDTDTAFLVEVADRSWLCKNPTFQIPINKQYNVRAPAWGDDQYYSQTLKNGVAWTWLGMVQDIWGLLSAQLGNVPETLPVTPDGTPEGWRFIGTSAWDALNDVLFRIGCTIKRDLTLATGQFSIVQIGASDATLDGVLSRAEGQRRKILDREVREAVRGRVPYGVRVFFNRVEKHYGTERSLDKDSKQWATNAVYSVDVDGPDITAAEAGTYHPIWDDLPAIYDGDTLTNSTALTDRAKERSTDFFRMLRTTGGGRLHQSYSGLIDVYPGSLLKTAAWRQDDEGGIITEILRHPFRPSHRADAAALPAGSTSNRAPDFNPTWPVWPRQMEWVVVKNPSGSEADSGSGASGSGGCDPEDGRIVRYNRSTCDWDEVLAVWVQPPNDELLDTDRRYMARIDGHYTHDGQTRPLFIPTPGGGCGGETVIKRPSTSRCINGRVHRYEGWDRYDAGCLMESRPEVFASYEGCCDCEGGIPPDPPPISVAGCCTTPHTMCATISVISGQCDALNGKEIKLINTFGGVSGGPDNDLRCWSGLLWLTSIDEDGDGVSDLCPPGEEEGPGCCCGIQLIWCCCQKFVSGSQDVTPHCERMGLNGALLCFDDECADGGEPGQGFCDGPERGGRIIEFACGDNAEENDGRRCTNVELVECSCDPPEWIYRMCFEGPGLACCCEGSGSGNPNEPLCLEIVIAECADDSGSDPESGSGDSGSGLSGSGGGFEFSESGGAGGGTPGHGGGGEAP